MMIHPTVFLYNTLFHLTHELSLGEELFGQHLFLDAFGCVAFDFMILNFGITGSYSRRALGAHTAPHRATKACWG